MKTASEEETGVSTAEFPADRRSARLSACRLILEGASRSGRWNMAVDEALLDAAHGRDEAVVRWYSWSEPTVSLGYFQSDADIAADPVLAGLPRVRRLTGGGAIVHHLEWTYSCVLPASQRLIRHPYDLYDLLHGVVIAWFAETRGIELELRGTSRRAARDPALCFLREDSHDVCLRGVKILGSAQRRRRGALLQHGSLVLRRSEFAPHVAGLCDLAPGCELVPEDGAALALRLGQALGQQVSVGALGDDEQRRAGELVAASAGTGLGPQRPN